MKPLALILFLTCLTFVNWAIASKQRLLYRYVDDNDIIVLDDHVPPKYIDKGYEIIDERGLTIEKISPALTEAEKASLQETKKLEYKRKEQLEKDRNLLQEYGSSKGAQNTRDRALNSIRQTKELSLSAIESAKVEIEELHVQAAIFERKGKTVSTSILERLSYLKLKIEKLTKEVKMKSVEEEEINKEFSPIIERLKLIETNYKLNMPD